VFERSRCPVAFRVYGTTWLRGIVVGKGGDDLTRVRAAPRYELYNPWNPKTDGVAWQFSRIFKGRERNALHAVTAAICRRENRRDARVIIARGTVRSGRNRARVNTNTWPGDNVISGNIASKLIGKMPKNISVPRDSVIIVVAPFMYYVLRLLRRTIYAHGRRRNNESEICAAAAYTITCVALGVLTIMETCVCVHG